MLLLVNQVSQFLQTHDNVAGIDGQPCSSGVEHAIAPLTIVVVDGTWGQTRRLAKKIPSALTRIRLDTASDGTFNTLYSSPLRKQPGPDRLCTLSALALLTRQLLGDSRVEERLLGLLHRKSEVFLAQHDKAWKKPEQWSESK